MAQTIDARVKQKTGTAADFAGYQLLAGEIALVRTSPSGPVWNFKVGPGNFDSLPWSLQTSGAAQEADTSTTFPSGVPGLYIPTENGTYNGVSVDLSVGYVQLIWDGSSLTKVEFPIDLNGYVKGGSLTNPVLAFVDELNNKTALYIDEQLRLSFNPMPKLIPMQYAGASSFFDFAIVDENGTVLLGVRNGLIVTSYDGPTDSGNDDTSENELFDQAYDYIQPSDEADNTIWNQWIEPYAANDSDGNTFFGGIGQGVGGSKGEIWLAVKRNSGLVRRKIIGRIRGVDQTDDHNAPAILIDNRTAAPYPVIVFQSEHSTHPMRMLRLTSKDPDEWPDNPEWVEMPGGMVAYAQAFRNGNEILVHCRAQVDPVGAPLQTRPMRWYYSSDNGDTWVYQEMFYKSEERTPYFLLKEKNNGSGINIAIATHPINSDIRGIFFLEMDWATGAIVNPANRSSPLISDFRTAFGDPSWSGINPYDGLALQVANPPSTSTRRLWDVSRSNTGECLIAYTLLPDQTSTAANYLAGRNRVVSFSLEDGNINYDIEVGKSGMPNERAAGNNAYVSGLCFINTKEVFNLEYLNRSLRHGGTDTVPNDGYTEGTIVDFTDPDNLVVNSVFFSRNKAMRPYNPKASRLLFICDCRRYMTFKDFISNLLIKNIQHLETWDN